MNIISRIIIPIFIFIKRFQLIIFAFPFLKKYIPLKPF